MDQVPAKSPIEQIPLDQTEDPIRSKPKNVIVILREEGVGDLANSLQTFAPRGSKVIVISKKKPEVGPVWELFSVCCTPPAFVAFYCDTCAVDPKAMSG